MNTTNPLSFLLLFFSRARERPRPANALPLFLLLLSLLLTSCGGTRESFLGDLELPSFGSDEDTDRQLELPPDLDAPMPTEDYYMSNSKVAAAMGSSVLPERLDMSLYREGDVVWLAVSVDPLSIWPNLRAFYESMGFTITEANPAHGYLQTNWRERVLQPAGNNAVIRVRDQFRLHLERAPNALTNIYIANRSSSYDQGGWRLNAPDRNAEWAMLQSLRDYLAALTEVRGVRRRTLETASAALDVLNVSGVPVLTIGQIYSRVWRRLNVALNRSGWEIVNSDRSRGIYYARRTNPIEENTGRLPTRRSPEQTVQLHLLAAKEQTLITAHQVKNGRPLTYEEAYDILRSVVNAYDVYDG